MRFLVDAQLPHSICALLAEPDHDVVHVKDVLSPAAKDAELWNMALTNAQVIVTKDEDFPRRLQISGNGPQIVWIRLGNCGNATLRKALVPIWPEICAMLAGGEKLVEIG